MGHPSVLHAFLELAATKPDVRVLVSLQHQRFWTLGTVLDAVNNLSQRLVSCGIARGDRIGVCMASQRDMVVASILAIWKVGAVVVPFNATLPADVKSHMVTKAGVDCVLADAAAISEGVLPSGVKTVIDVEEDEDLDDAIATDAVALSSADEAIVFFTSGSTGQPKGVRLSHGAIVNRFEWMWDTYPFEDDDVCCIKTSVSFVDMLWESLGPLCKGVLSVIVPMGARKDVARMLRVLEDHKVTRLVAVPSLLGALCHLASHSPEKMRHLRMVITSGEVLSKYALNQYCKICPDSVILNLYGSTEVAGDITCMEYEAADAPFQCVHIGKVVSNNKCHVLNNKRCEVDPGMVGELVVSGMNLAEGYLQSEDDDGKFIPNPFAEEDGYPVAYCTGDLVRYEIAEDEMYFEYVGRKDRQVKVNGHRIELDGIEKAIAAFPPVENVAVVVFDDNYVRSIVAYVVGDTTRQEVVDYAKKVLHEVSVPAVSITKNIPVLSNGKVDRMYLEQCTDWLNQDEYEPPRTFLQIQLAQVFESVLPIIVSMSTNFFDRGGDSLSAVRLISRINERFGMELSYIDIAENPTLRQLSQLVKDLQDQNKKSTEYVSLRHFEQDVADSFEIMPLTLQDVDVVQPLLHEEFLKKESLLLSVIQLYGEEQVGKEFHALTSMMIPDCIKQGFCVCSKESEDGPIIGVTLCEVMSKVEEGLPPQFEALGVIGSFLGHMDGRYMREFIGDTPPEKVLHITMSTSSSDSALGYHVVYGLESAVLKMAKEAGFKKAVTCATHAVTKDMAELMGFKSLFEVSYTEYEDKHGRHPFMHSRDLHMGAAYYEIILNED